MKLYGNKKKSRNKKKKKASRLKALFITLTVLATVCVCVAVFLQIYIRPPDIPSIEDPERKKYEVEQPDHEFNDDDARINQDRIAPEGMTDDDRKKDFYTFMIVGIDKSGNTDTIMVGSYDQSAKKANLISIPRDSKVNVKRKLKKINAAYASGTQNGGGKAGGVDQLMREVSTIIGFRPDFFVTVGLEAFTRLVDTVGGVDVTVPFDMKYTDPTQNLKIDLTKGKHTLNGAEALTFARYRHGDPGYPTISDYKRIEHQQMVIKNLLSKILTKLNKIPEYIDIFTDNVYSDIDYGQLVWFADQLRKLDSADALSTYTMPTTGTSGLPNYYELLDKNAIIELVNETINPYNKPIKPEDVDIID